MEILDQINQIVDIRSLVAALAILLVGWIVALVISGLARRALQRTSLDDRIVGWIYGDKAGDKIVADRWVAKGVYYLIMLFVLVAFFQALQLTAITEPLNRLLGELFVYAPRLLGAGLILLVAWVIASISRFAVSRVLQATKLDEQLSDQAGVPEDRRARLGDTTGNVAFWLVLLLFLPAVVSALNLTGLVSPVQNMVGGILNYLPKLLGAALILLGGWIGARIVRQVVTNLLAAAGADRLGQRVGMGTGENRQSLSEIVGTVVYALILIPTVVAALQALEVAAISDPATQMLSGLLNAVPSIFGAVVILAIAFVVGRLVSQLVSGILTGVGFNRLLVWLGLGKEPAEGQRTPAEVVGYLVLVGILLFAAVEAANVLGLVIVADLLAQFITFAGQILMGLLIFGVGLYLAGLARGVVMAAGGRQASLMAQGARIAIIVLVAAMALRQMGIANEIVNLAFGLVLGSIAVAVAIAFGLGSRDAAARQVEEWRQSLRGPERSAGDD